MFWGGPYVSFRPFCFLEVLVCLWDSNDMWFLVKMGVLHSVSFRSYCILGVLVCLLNVNEMGVLVKLGSLCNLGVLVCL